MIKNIKNVLKTSAFILLGSFMVWNCESDADNLGSQFFEGDAAQGTKQSFDVIAYNINNNDSIRSDAAKLTYALLGAFNESQFGMQKASYVSQVRLSSYDPDFGTNPVVDSVVLVMKPTVATDSVTTTTVEDYIYPDGNVAAKKVVNTYPLAYKYGKTKIGGTTMFNIKVNEVDDFLGGASDTIYSNKTVAVGTLLGTKTFNGSLSSIKITKDSDNSELFSRDATLRIPLDGTFFQNKIIAKDGSTELSNVANFIRYFKGIRISVDETDGYLWRFAPNTMEMVMYYKRDVTTNGVTTPTQTSLSFSMGSGNVHFSQFEFNRTSAAISSYVTSVSDTIAGNTKLYAQGAGGPDIGIKIPDTVLENIKTLYTNNKIGIISAKVRLYSDTSSWSNTYEKPDTFVLLQKNLYDFLVDVTTFSNYQLVTGFDLDENPAYYDVSFTNTFKNYIENDEDQKHLILKVGDFEYGTTGYPTGINYNTRVYTPNRVVLVGTDATNEKRAQLNIIYGTKTN